MLYNDRKMKKWQGFMLTEHNAELRKQKENSKEIVQRKQQDLSEITSLLEHSYKYKTILSIQLNITENGNFSKDLVGFIGGYDEEYLYLVSKHKQHRITVAQIRNIVVQSKRKLYHD
jgi:hypothetical protein